MWQYQLDEDHFYDLRDLPVGGWFASGISCRPDGPWMTFSHPSMRRPINSLRRVHREKGYRPPVTPLTNALCSPSRTPPPEREFCMTTDGLRSLSSPGNHLPELVERTVSRPPHSGSLFERSLRSANGRASTAIGPRRLDRPSLNLVVLEDQNLPDRPADFDRRLGVDAARPPFRKSQIVVRNQIRQMEIEADVTETAKTRRRPATTGTWRGSLFSRKPDEARE
jgi:hypothetical protein